MQSFTPDGICSEAARPGAMRANPMPLILLGALLAAGFAGVLGGQSSARHAVETQSAVLTVTTPETLRNGMVFETVVEVRAKRDLEDMVVGISDDLWREITINTMIPAAEGEEYADGYHRFAFGKMKAGETFRFKIDGQINPPLLGNTAGEIAAFDGERRMAELLLHTRVLP